MIIGPTPAGEVIEVGVVDTDADDADARVIHAMRARPKFWS